jgi:hypothetical protein
MLAVWRSALGAILSRRKSEKKGQKYELLWPLWSFHVCVGRVAGREKGIVACVGTIYSLAQRFLYHVPYSSSAEKKELLCCEE